jgi:5'-nucleotidase
MPYAIQDKLVVGITSSALFDFTVEHEIYVNKGLDAFKKYQADNRKKPPAPGAAFPFIKRLLHLNQRFPIAQ